MQLFGLLIIAISVGLLIVMALANYIDPDDDGL